MKFGYLCFWPIGTYNRPEGNKYTAKPTLPAWIDFPKPAWQICFRLKPPLLGYEYQATEANRRFLLRDFRDPLVHPYCTHPLS